MARSIVCTPGTCSGSPRIDGTRLTCQNIITMLIEEFGLERVLSTYEYLTLDDIIECARYCSLQECLKDHPLHYCEGCTLDDRVEKPPDQFIDLKDLKNIVQKHSSPNTSYLGTENEYENDSVQKDIWLLANEWLNRHRGSNENSG